MGTFSELVEESGSLGPEWTIVFVASLAGQAARAPTHDDAEAPLQRMVESIKAGAHGSFIPFDRNTGPYCLNEVPEVDSATDGGECNERLRQGLAMHWLRKDRGPADMHRNVPGPQSESLSMHLNIRKRWPSSKSRVGGRVLWRRSSVDSPAPTRTRMDGKRPTARCRNRRARRSRPTAVRPERVRGRARRRDGSRAVEATPASRTALGTDRHRADMGSREGSRC